jgi:regulator of sirC expression with transglutaminase-like and TPR domain
MRAQGDDLNAALADYRAAVGCGGEPPETHRGLGAIYRQRNQLPEARASFQRYLELAPNAPDAPMIKSYMEEAAT